MPSGAVRWRKLWAVEQTRLERREIAWFELAMLLDVAGIELLHTPTETGSCGCRTR